MPKQDFRCRLHNGMSSGGNVHWWEYSLVVHGDVAGTSQPIECKQNGGRLVGGTPLSLDTLGNEGAEGTALPRSFQQGSFR